MHPSSAITRRIALAGLASAPGLALAAPARKVVTLLGDSITSGYGLPRDKAVPAELQRLFTDTKQPIEVRGAGVSGDTTALGLARVDRAVQADTTLCVVMLGGNDLLQGVLPSVMQRNLTQIVERLRARRINVLLAGLTAPEWLFGAYGRQFNAVFPAVARASGVPIVADALGTVLGNPDLNQPDLIHPNSAGVAVIVQRLAPSIIQTLG